MAVMPATPHNQQIADLLRRQRTCKAKAKRAAEMMRLRGLDGGALATVVETVWVAALNEALELMREWPEQFASEGAELKFQQGSARGGIAGELTVLFRNSGAQRPDTLTITAIADLGGYIRFASNGSQAGRDTQLVDFTSNDIVTAAIGFMNAMTPDP